jgi:predicted O-linked N-acetylglucosamine transferase (SPINDLY family)
MAKLSTVDALKLALDHHKAGNFVAAEQIYRKVLVHDTNNADALHLLGVLLRQTGHVRTGIDLLRRAVDANPNIAQFRNHLGEAMRDMGQADEAADTFRAAIQMAPNYAEAHNNLGSVLHDLRQLPQSVAAFRKAIALTPDLPDFHSNLGNVLLDLGRVDEAAGECRAAIRLNPNFVEAHNNLGNALAEQGLVDEALDHYRTAATLVPSFQIAWANFLFKMQMSDRYDGAAILEEHRNWNQQCAQPLSQNIAPHTNSREPERRLRIGYVSQDFRDHPVGRFLLPLLANHDREQFEPICFADGVTFDDYTHRLRAHTAGWHVTSLMNDAELADLVRHEHIDILVDLRVHSSPNRLLVFARKPAPVQMTYLGYPGTTALATMDYRLTDELLDPPGNDAFYTEQSIRLTGTYWCYEPHPTTPDIAPLPAARAHGNAVTFGCLNAFGKMSPSALALWRDLLVAIPNSTLLLHALAGSHRDRVKNEFAQGGVDPRRIDFVGKQSFTDYLHTYGRIDIALDPFPFNGGTTTCDALWMGCPVVTLAGQIAVAREGVSILTRAGFPKWVANSREQYVAVAKALAQDHDQLSTIRASMRPALASSPLMDRKAYARGVEQAYRSAWQQWCRTKA